MIINVIMVFDNDCDINTCWQLITCWLLMKLCEHEYNVQLFNVLEAILLYEFHQNFDNTIYGFNAFGFDLKLLGKTNRIEC